MFRIAERLDLLLVFKLNLSLGLLYFTGNARAIFDDDVVTTLVVDSRGRRQRSQGLHHATTGRVIVLRNAGGRQQRVRISSVRNIVSASSDAELQRRNRRFGGSGTSKPLKL